MTQQRLSRLFAIFFDPAVPITFVAGSIVLAILGNSIYDILVEGLGAQPYKLWYIAVGSALIFMFIVVGAWVWVGTRRQSPVKQVPPEHEAEPQGGLILCVSPGILEDGNELHAIRRHREHGTLQHCWMIVSPESMAKGQQLRAMLASERVVSHMVDIADSYQARLAYRAVERSLDEALALPGQLSIVVDITGGTRPMAAGAVLACRDYGLAMEYVLGKYVNGRLDRSAKPQIMKVDLA